MQCVSIWKSQKNLVTQDLRNDRQTRLQNLTQIFFFLMHWYQSLTTDVQERRHTDLNSHCNWFKSYYLMEAKGNNQQVSKKAIKRAPPPRFRELHIYVLLDFLHILQSKLYITMDSWLKEVWESCLLLRLKWICHHLYICSWMLIFIQILFQ